MNERIKEIIEQCEDFGSWDNKVYSFDKEKFAELIIRDCASLCEIESRSYTYSFTPAKARLAESTAKHCAHIIKRHFGVEE
jgi:hypothetical protein